MGIRKASKAIIPTWTLADLGITAPATVVSTLEILNPPSREVNCEILFGTPQRGCRKTRGKDSRGEGAMNIWVYIDHFKGTALPTSWEAVGVAKSLGATVTGLVLGAGVEPVAKQALNTAPMLSS